MADTRYPVLESRVSVVDCGSNLLALNGFQCGADSLERARSTSRDEPSLGEGLLAKPLSLLHQILDQFQPEDARTDGERTDRRHSMESAAPNRFRQAESPSGKRPYPSPAPSPPGASPLMGSPCADSPGAGLSPAPFCWKMAAPARAGPAVIENELRRLRRHYPALVQHQVQPDEGTDRSGDGRYNYTVNGRPVVVYVVPGKKEKDAATLMIRDGPLTQPLIDYVFQTGKNEDYESLAFDGQAIRLMPEATRMKVPDAKIHPQDRLAAMHCAKHQADLREDHARRHTGNNKRDEQSSFASGSTRASGSSFFGFRY